MIRLTEEEILYHWTLPSLISSTEYGILKAVAKAQLKKDIETIKDLPHGTTHCDIIKMLQEGLE